MDATGKSAEISSSIYKSAMEQSGANARANLQFNAPSGIEKLVQRMQTDPKFAAAYKDYASIGPEAKGEQTLLAKYAGPQGAIALQMLEASGPEGKAQAQIIRQALKQSASSMLKPQNVAEALP